MGSDTFERTIYHRSNVIANDTVLLTLAERDRLDALHLPASRSYGSSAGADLPNDGPNGLLNTFGVGDIELMPYGVGNDGGTFILTVLGLPNRLARLPESQAPSGPRPLRLMVLTCTLGTATEVNKNPISGIAVAATTFRAVDTMVDTSTIVGTTMKLWDAGGDNGVARVLFDPLGCASCFAYVTALTNVTRVDIAARRMLNTRGF